MVNANQNLLQSGLFGSNSKQSEGSIVNDRRTAPALTNISTCVAVSVTEPKPFFPIVGFEKNQMVKTPLYSQTNQLVMKYFYQCPKMMARLN